MYWYASIGDIHRYLAYASVVFFGLRAFGMLLGIEWLKDGRIKVLSFAVDVPLTMTGLSLWSMAGINPIDQPWLLSKFVLLIGYVAFGAWAMRAREREVTLLAMLLAAVCMGLLFAVSMQRSATGGLF